MPSGFSLDITSFGTCLLINALFLLSDSRITFRVWRRVLLLFKFCLNYRQLPVKKECFGLKELLEERWERKKEEGGGGEEQEEEKEGRKKEGRERRGEQKSQAVSYFYIFGSACLFCLESFLWSFLRIYECFSLYQATYSYFFLILNEPCFSTLFFWHEKSGSSIRL